MTGTECELLIVGCGPTGVVLATLLGRLGRDVVILEREAEVHPIPRATHIDGETLRNFQTTGLMADLLPHTIRFGQFDVVGHKGQVILSETIEEKDDLHAWRDSRFFDQPAFEGTLRQGLSRYPNVKLHLGVEASSIEQNSNSVTVQAQSSEGAALPFHARWVVGCDGGRSMVRKVLGTQMESLAPSRPWVIVDVLLRQAEAARLLPERFQYYLDSERLTLYAHGIGLHRRWEFQLGREENVPADSEVLRWVGKFIDLARIEVKRIAVYAHHALIARSWRQGRVLLAGDAAHMMPPSAGQGMCSGIRDAVNLAWKLDRAVMFPDANSILDTYQQERRPHVCEILQRTLFISNRLQADSQIERWWRRLRIGAIATLPWLRAAALRAVRRRPVLREGFIERQSPYFGQHLPQPRVRQTNGELLLDDLLGYQFALIVKPDFLNHKDVAWCKQWGVCIWTLGVDFTEMGDSFSQWWQKHQLDFALVRPDHYVFGCGRKPDLVRIQENFSRWWRPRT